MTTDRNLFSYPGCRRGLDAPMWDVRSLPDFHLGA